ncbi:c-type cytochrome [Arenimonas sp.]|uniref:c-type cytochrome n=1 Tax=Arenimonas sp. TaxID=1872635 RepID=UPI0039E697C6
MRRIFLFSAMAFAPLAVAGPAAPLAKPAKLGQCVACHGEDGRSRVAGTPHLAGQDETYLVNALGAYRNGKRQAQPMNSLANTLQPRDIAALAKWYAAQGSASAARGKTPGAAKAQGASR